MAIDIAKLDEKIRRLQQIRELASDPEMRKILADVITVNGNGTHRMSKKAQKGALTDIVETACRESGAKFTVKDVVERMEAQGYHFSAKDSEIATYNAMRRLRKKGVLTVVEEGGPGKPAYWSVAAGQKLMKLDT